MEKNQSVLEKLARLRSQLTVRKTTTGFAKFPMSTEEAAAFIDTALRLEVADRGKMFIDSSELQGYISYESDSEGNHKNHFKKELSCLRPWKPADDANGQKQELHTNNIPTLFGNKELRKTMKFDYNALDTSIYMNKNGM